ncbi:MAG: fumarylacetoacetate hydrolase family protein [Saprospiraceae bacterium]|nr:fumarylacetoacetate hydrolase family protein [Saprospiraceae bacterium]
MTTSADLTALAKRLDQAACQARPVAQISHEHPISIDDAYVIQEASIAERLARGEAIVGIKMGFTSLAKMEQMGVHDMIWGRLTDTMQVPNRGSLQMKRLIHPRAEPEICFRISREISHMLSAAEVRAFVDGVAAAVEVIDSRYENFKFSLEDVVADNCSSAAFVVGTWKSPDMPLGDLEISLAIDGEVVHRGSSSAILGDPWESVAAATRLAAQYGFRIPVGAYLMAGSATPAVYLEQGQTVEVEVEALGACGFTTV